MARLVPGDQAIIEIGSYRGLSASFLAEGAQEGRDAHVTCIDPWPDPDPNESDREHAERQRGALSAFIENMDGIGWPVTVLRTDAVSAARIWLQRVGMWFHDADHSYRAVERDFRAWRPLMIRGCWIAFHDYLGDQMEKTEVAQFVDARVAESTLQQVSVTEKLWTGRLT